MKPILVFTFLVVIALVESKENSVRDTFYDCDPQENDKQLFSRHFEDKGSILSKKTITFSYPEQGEGQETIHCISAIDHLEEQGKDGGRFQVLSGGVGQTFAVMRIESDRGDGYNYDVTIWGC